LGFAPINEQMDLLRQGAVDLVSEEELAAKLERATATDTALVVKVGFDPSAPDIHLGHTVVMHKMKQFQDLGHEVVFVVGDFTGMIGDPSGKSKTRPQLTPEQIQANARTYEEQAFRILDPARSRTEFNSTWLNELGAAGLIRLAAKYTVARMMERDDFKKRYEAQQPIALHEFLYPLAQAYDSVALKADVEMGGTDQLFNLLVGRDIMREYGLDPQVVLTMPLLVGTDGVDKMSKSLDNYIGIDDEPGNMYGKVLSLSDETMWSYWQLCTERTDAEIELMQRQVAAGELHPKAAKQALARAIVARYNDKAAAQAAEAEFERVFAGGQLPTEMPEVHLPGTEPVWVVDVIKACEFAASNGEARRLIKQGAVSLDGERITDDQHHVAADGAERVLKVGKRRFARVTVAV
jgi:tyrosyl-tRNA synthetase